MNRNLKIALIILGIVLILCLCICVVGVLFFRIAGDAVSGAVSTDPTRAAQVASEIAEFDLPAGFEQGSMEFFGFQVVVLQGNGSQSETNIMLMQFPASLALSVEQMRQQVETFANQQAAPLGLEFNVVGETDVQVKGEQVTFSILEGESSNGVEYRQWAGIIQGNGGPTFLTITGTLEQWDQELIDDFLASIH